MGSVCCCLNVGNTEDYVNPNTSAYMNCTCLHCFVDNCLNVYTSLFRREVHSSSSSSIQGAASFTSIASFDNSLCATYRTPPRPLPYNADPRYVRLQVDELVSRREKGSGHLHEEESEPLRSDIDIDIESLSKANKLKGSIGGDDLRKSSFKFSATSTTASAHFYTFSEDEDVCPTCLEDIHSIIDNYTWEDKDVYPTCLEEYSLENPKIMTKCSHHFHLGCIYEWMERSESCPVCGKLMAFDETTSTFA